MTIAPEPEQPLTSADAERSAPQTGLGGLTLLPAFDGADAGLCIDGACRLPGAKD